MYRWLFRRRLAVIAFAALALVVPPVLAQSDGRSGPVGTWLIEPVLFDAWIDSGIDVPWYPLLVVRADGAFTLFRIAPSCVPVLPDGGMLDSRKPEDRQRQSDICAAAQADAAKDGFIAAYLHESAAGRWSIGGDGRVTFAAARRGPTPDGIARLLPHLRSRLRADIDSARSAAERAALEALLRIADAQGGRLSTIYTTFYVFDGAALHFDAGADRLRLDGGERGALAYRRVRPEPLDAVMAISAQVGITVARFFRCMFARLERDWPAGAAPTGDFAILAVQLRALSPDFARQMRARRLAQDGRRNEAARLWSDADETRVSRATDELHRHSVLKALGESRFGAMIGCPERDPAR